MKKLFYFLLVVALIATGAAPRETAPGTKIIGAWKLLRAQYGEAAMKDQAADERAYKMFTGTRWSGSFFNVKAKTFDGSGGGTYTLREDQYIETVEYFSWDPETVGKKFTFTLKIENGLLHQQGTIEYKGNPKYTVNEWYERAD